MGGGDLRLKAHGAGDHMPAAPRRITTRHDTEAPRTRSARTQYFRPTRRKHAPAHRVLRQSARVVLAATGVLLVVSVGLVVSMSRSMRSPRPSGSPVAVLHARTATSSKALNALTPGVGAGNDRVGSSSMPVPTNLLRGSSTTTATPGPGTTVPAERGTPSATSAIGAPADLAPLGVGAFPGEGHWAPAGRAVQGRTAVWTTTLRPASGGPAVGIARMDTALLDVVAFAGTTQPGGSWSNKASVPAERHRSLVAAFNGGFQFASAGGGFYADGHAQPALRNGAASLVVRTDGSAEVDEWGRDASLTPDVVAVRQNLGLLVDAGAAVASTARPGLWGATLSHTAVTWRSAVGSDISHHLYFVGGPGLTPAGLAGVLVAAGATRAMEYDINPQWVLFASYSDGFGYPPLTVGTKLLDSMNYGPDHFLAPNWRDFVALFAKSPPALPA